MFMKHLIGLLIQIGLFAVIVLSLWWASIAPISQKLNISIIIGGTLVVPPVSWFGRRILDRNPKAVIHITTFVHFTVMLLLGVSFIRTLITHQSWPDWVLPVPSGIGQVLVIITGTACLLTVINLALKGLGAPFFIALSRKLAADWLYARTRNPMVLATLTWFLSLGIWFQSVLFVSWVLILFTPALITYLKVYEERELEIRFGASYLEYKSRTPFLFPGLSRG